MARMDAAAGTANAKVLLHPTTARSVVHASNQVSSAVVDFQSHLGIESGREDVEARRWVEAATEARDKVLETGAGGVDAARAFGNEAAGKARTAKSKFSSGIAERARRRRGGEDVGDGAAIATTSTD